MTPWAGPGGATWWNADPTCTAASPEVFAATDALYLVWEENCGAGRQLYLRKVE